MEFYRSHWVQIEPDRLARYDQFLQWTPLMEPLLNGFDLRDGQLVVDYGCGPGWVSLELARRVAPAGRVVACDINRDLLALGQQHAAEVGLGDRVLWRHVEEDRIPIADASADRLFCKNVLEYVPSIDEAIREFRRVLKRGGIARLVDSDWDLLVVEPLGAERVRQLLAHARHAYNDAQAGRHLYGAARRAGFADLHLRVAANADTDGNLRPVLQNVVGYAVAAGYPQVEADRLLEDVDRAAERQELLILLPQFILTALVP